MRPDVPRKVGEIGASGLASHAQLKGSGLTAMGCPPSKRPGVIFRPLMHAGLRAQTLSTPLALRGL